MLRLEGNLRALLLCAALIPGSALAAGAKGGADDNLPPGGARAAAAAAMPHYGNHGHFVCTAAINANGSVFSGEYVNAAKTFAIPGMVGTYQVVFNTSAVSADAPCGDIRIALGWYRVCQPDTLTYGTLPARICTVADRYTEASGVWVQTFDANGNLVATPFTLSVSR
jgi:hypothetical protein